MNIINNIITNNLSIVLITLSASCLLLLIITIILFIKVIKISNRYSKFMQGKNAKSLEEDIVRLFEENKKAKEDINKNKSNIKYLTEKQKTNFQKMGLAKYDAFKEMGGSLSFALAMLDDNNDGFVLNSVYSSEGCYSYSKMIKNADSEIQLRAEEKIAIERALKGTSSNPVAE